MTAAAPLDPRAEVEAIVRRSGTSFALGMRILERPRREAMHALYAFARQIDDIADGPDAPADKAAALAAWAAEIEALYAGRPTRPIARALAGPVATYGLPKDEFLLLIEGMAWDAAGPIRAPSEERLRAYCRRVAGAVGVLSMPIFGARPGPAADGFAIAMGEGLQRANIVRDVAEDAAEGRVYLSQELLAAHALPTDPLALIRAPSLPAARAALAAQAQACFALAHAHVREIGWRVVRPALVMEAAYRAMLATMAADGFRSLRKPRIGTVTRAAVALRALLAPPAER